MTSPSSRAVDFFPPIVDDPYNFGAVAAANSLSDIYAMGARPIIGLNIVGFPIGLPKDILAKILKGGSDKMTEAGAIIVGGHTIDDNEPKYGISVTGLVKPGEQVANVGAVSGDKLVLDQAHRYRNHHHCPQGGPGRQRDRRTGPFRIMAALNKEASYAMVHVGVNACTDITGFGLMGHLAEMTRGSHVGARSPSFQGTLPSQAFGTWPSRASRREERLRNLKSVRHTVEWDNGISSEARTVLCDAQTSGGLLISVAPEKADQLMDDLRARNVSEAAIIGEVIDDDRGRIQVAP